MKFQDPAARRRARSFASVAALGSAVMLVFTTWAYVTASAAGTNAGSAQVVDPNTNQPLNSGGSSTNFTLKLPSGAACTGDSASGGYKVQSYMVMSSVDPSTLQFGSAGPTPTGTGANFHEPLFQTNSNPYVNAQTANATTQGGPGPIINIPAFNFAVYSPGDIPAGTYNIGIACTSGPPTTSSTQEDKFWNVQLTFSTNPSDSPAQVTWVVTPTTTTTTSTSTTAPPTSTTGPTTTTTGPTTTTTTQSTTTTTSPSGSTTTTTQPTTTTTSPSGSTTTTSPTGSTTTTTSPTGSTTTTSGGGTASVTDSSGNPIAPNSTLTNGQQITVSGDGFAPGETVTFAVHSATVTIGTAVADSAGHVSKFVLVPSTLDPGQHTLTLTGATSGRVLTFPFIFATAGGGTTNPSGGVTTPATASSSNPLAFTGADPLKLLFWALLLVIFGRLAVVLSEPKRGR